MNGDKILLINQEPYNRAFFHYRQVQQNHYSYLYDSENAEHRQRLWIAATQPPPCKVYINLLPAPWAPPNELRAAIHAYMKEHFRWWNYNQAHSLHIQLNDRYGKMFLLLSWKGKSAEVPLEEIELFRPCATT